MGKKSTDIPPPDPRMYAALDKQIAQGDQMIDFIKQSTADNNARQAKLDTQNSKAIEQQMRLADQSETRANDAYTFYQQKGRPVVEQALDDAKNYDSQANIDNARGRATADVASAFENAEGQSARALSRMGINPTSGRFMALNSQLQAQKALAMSGAATNAEETRRSQGMAARQQGSNIAQGLTANSMGFAGQSGQMGSSAAGIGNAGMQSAMSVQNQAIGGMGSAANIYGSGASGYNNVLSNQMKGAEITSQANQSAMGGIGQIAGLAAAFMANGGKVGAGNVSNGEGNGGQLRGPGTGTSDQIAAVNGDTGQPIRLSNGEFVIPKDVVAAKGKEFFQKLIHKHHTPVHGNLRSA